ncbi:MAG TPA: bifunctional transaldolase/phosoglucose isomerase, partial [Pelolinea sp.]|nr:bifunctional transaldolase/phosoglucose isomerase [Pelolinea sp.]
LGQSLWLDNINRSALINGELEKWIKNGIVWGVTSNPSIFQKAITSSDAYTATIQAMSWAGLGVEDIYGKVVLQDIRATADLLYPVYKKTEKKDGYVSIEVNPDLANNTQETIDEAERFWNLVGRPNVMIKIPATEAGIFSIRKTIAKGINVNVTLIFSLERYKQVINAYFSGLEDRISAGGDISFIHSVASFFVSRIDSKTDRALEELIKNQLEIKEKVTGLKGKIAIANAFAVYEEFLASIQSDRYMKLQEKGATIQRPLWASTSTKNPEYSDTLYIQSLILPDTVNTVPDNTLTAFLDHGKELVIDFEQELKKAKTELVNLALLGINLDDITKQLENDGVAAFSTSQRELLSELEKLVTVFQKEIAPLKEKLHTGIKEISGINFIKRLCECDVSLWPANEKGQEEIAHRLDWIDAPKTSMDTVKHAELLLKDLLSEGFSHAVVLGMGGSSLAPEVFGELVNIFPHLKSGLDLSILDSTAPGQILAKKESLPLDKTLFIVSSKSGTTSEMEATFSFFWDELEKAGEKNTGKHFVAITDPGTPLADLGKMKEFRQVIQANPNVGGRYSALIEFGIIPAVLAGIDGEKLLRYASEMMIDCASDESEIYQSGVMLGILLARAVESGKDKLTIIADPGLTSVGAWIEQLIAESSGKLGKGILPVNGEPTVAPNCYSKDRFFVYLANDGQQLGFVNSLLEAGQPVITFPIKDLYPLGAEFYRWELATAVACSFIGVNAFDQPNVQLSKSITKEMISEFKTKKTLDAGQPIFSSDEIIVFGNQETQEIYTDIKKIIGGFIKGADKDGFIAINAFVSRNKANEKKLQQLRRKILERTDLATTLGFGPRFLHSTGQLHKGGKNNGLFIVITTDQ